MNEPTNKELMHLIVDIKDNVSEIKLQTMKTNGRVSSLEMWKSFLQGGLGVVAIIVVPIIIYLLTHYK